jgi:LysR family transcriptional activator of nhaA
VLALPVLLPSGHSALRATRNHRFDARGPRPRTVVELEDSTRLAVLAARGLGVFQVGRLGAHDVGLMRVDRAAQTGGRAPAEACMYVLG